VFLYITMKGQEQLENLTTGYSDLDVSKAKGLAAYILLVVNDSPGITFDAVISSFPNVREAVVAKSLNNLIRYEYITGSADESSFGTELDSGDYSDIRSWRGTVKGRHRR